MNTFDVAAKVENFFKEYPVRKYPKGQIIIFAGENPAKVFYIIKGQVKQYDVSYRGDEVVLNNFKPKAFFPMSLAINEVSNPYIFEAVVETEVHIAPAKEVIAFLHQNPEVTYDLLSRLYRGVDGVLGRMVQLMSGGARARLLYELILESRRFGKTNDNGNYVLNMSEKELGSLSGLSRETVSRELTKLKSDGLIDIHNKELIIKDISLLQQKLGSEV